MKTVGKPQRFDWIWSGNPTIPLAQVACPLDDGEVPLSEARKAERGGLCERKCPEFKGIFHSRGGGFPHEPSLQEAVAEGEGRGFYIRLSNHPHWVPPVEAIE